MALLQRSVALAPRAPDGNSALLVCHIEPGTGLRPPRRWVPSRPQPEKGPGYHANEARVLAGEPRRRTQRRRPSRAQQERSEEHTSELQSQSNLVCRLLLEKKKQHSTRIT